MTWLFKRAPMRAVLVLAASMTLAIAGSTMAIGVDVCSQTSILPPPYCGANARASVSTLGIQGDSFSSDPAISADGRHVAFVSEATNLVVGDSNGAGDVFVHDRRTRETTLVSVTSAGVPGNSFSGQPSISADGRYVAFFSLATLVPEDTSIFVADIYVHDRATAQTSLVSVGLEGAEANNGSFFPSISADGRFIAFDSIASNLVLGDTNSTLDTFVYDRETAQTTRVSVASDGSQAVWPVGSNLFNGHPSISADGRYVAFESRAVNLVPGDTNDRYDIFLHDRLTPETKRVSVSPDGIQSNGDSTFPSISADGRLVAFQSIATNLVDGDTTLGADVFVHDTNVPTTDRVSVASGGTQATCCSRFPSISSDGRFVTFEGSSPALVPGDTNRKPDIFVHDRVDIATERISVRQDGGQARHESEAPSISADGRYVAFESLAQLVMNDDNRTWDVYVRDTRFSYEPPATIDGDIDVEVSLL